MIPTINKHAVRVEELEAEYDQRYFAPTFASIHEIAVEEEEIPALAQGDRDRISGNCLDRLI